MGERKDIGLADIFVARGECGRAAVRSCINRKDLPPRITLGLPVYVTLKFIFYQYFRFVYIMSSAPPSQTKSDSMNGYHDAILRWRVFAKDDRYVYFWFD